MKVRTITGLALALAVVVRSAAAQECPTAQIGQTCDAGGCVQATCTDTDVDGSITVRNCGACVDLGPNSCPSSDVGKSCGDAGGICNPAGGGGGATSTSGAGPSFMITYSVGNCSIPSNAAGGGSHGRGSGEADAGVKLGIGGEDAASFAQTPPGSKQASDCAMSPAQTGRFGPLALTGIAGVFLRRRTKSRLRRGGPIKGKGCGAGSNRPTTASARPCPICGRSWDCPRAIGHCLETANPPAIAGHCP